MTSYLVLIILLPLSAAQQPEGVFQVQVLVTSYDNPTSRCQGCGATFGCCDQWPITTCSGAQLCDNLFSVCLREYQASSADTFCPFHVVLTTNSTVINADHLTFGVGGTALHGLPNPILFTIPLAAWPTPEGFQLYVQVQDYDPIASGDAPDDLVDRFFINRQFSAPDTVPTRYSGVFGFGQLGVGFTVTCEDNYYGPDCDVFCEGRDDDLGHYTCGSNGERICINNYYGPNCTTFCEERDDDLGHYTCDGNGARVCLENYYGPSCTTFCEERDDEQGHYTCDSEGSIVCRDGYGGVDMDCVTDLDPCGHTVPCQNGGTCINSEALEDSVNYTCECADGYEGRNCEIDVNACDSDPCQNGGECVELLSSYTCTCQPGYTGSDCEVAVNDCINTDCSGNGRCVDRVNSYSCVCNPGYSGRFCEQEIVTENSATDGTTSQDDSLSGILGGVLGGLIVIILIAVVATTIVFVGKKQLRSKQVGQVPSGDPDNMELSPNPLYAMSAPQIDYYINDGMGPGEPMYDYPVVNSLSPRLAS